MTSLLVRSVDDALVQNPRERAAEHDRSAEAAPHEILAKALRKPQGKAFAEVLMDIPNVGDDADFVRVD